MRPRRKGNGGAHLRFIVYVMSGCSILLFCGCGVFDYISLSSSSPVSGSVLHAGDMVTATVEYSCELSHNSTSYDVYAFIRDKDDNVSYLGNSTIVTANSGTATVGGTFSGSTAGSPYTLEVAVGYWDEQYQYYQDATYGVYSNYYN